MARHKWFHLVGICLHYVWKITKSNRLCLQLFSKLKWCLWLYFRTRWTGFLSSTLLLKYRPFVFDVLIWRLPSPSPAESANCRGHEIPLSPSVWATNSPPPSPIQLAWMSGGKAVKPAACRLGRERWCHQRVPEGQCFGQLSPLSTKRPVRTLIFSSALKMHPGARLSPDWVMAWHAPTEVSNWQLTWCGGDLGTAGYQQDTAQTRPAPCVLYELFIEPIYPLLQDVSFVPGAVCIEGFERIWLLLLESFLLWPE